MRRAVLALVVLCAACEHGPQPGVRKTRQAATPHTVRQLGSWAGKGNTTLGFVSESGSFRINWTARSFDAAHPGAFQLTLRSGISGRPMKVIADVRGSGSGTVEFGDDPRMYEFLVESSGAEWSVAVEETFAPQPQD